MIPYLRDDDLDLDAIDGEFYWRCCRRDLHSDVEDLVAAIPRFSQGEVGPLSGKELEQVQALEDAIDRLVSRFEPEDPHIARHLF
jgi:hypothetical protein